MKTGRQERMALEVPGREKERVLVQAPFADLGKLQLGNQSAVLVAASPGDL